jgi:plasmid stability protein
MLSLTALLSGISMPPMPTLTIRNVPDRVHQALRRRAAENERSVEAEVRALLEAASTSKASDWRSELGDIQKKARKALGDPPKGAVKRFVAERRSDWDEK